MRMKPCDRSLSVDLEMQETLRGHQLKTSVVWDHQEWEMKEVNTHIGRAVIDTGLYRAKMRR